MLTDTREQNNTDSPTLCRQATVFWTQITSCIAAGLQSLTKLIGRVCGVWTVEEDWLPEKFE